MNNTGIIILAAGKSSRFADVKQLTNYNGKSLLRHVTDEALLVHLYPVIVVTGANAKSVAISIAQQPVEIIYNEHWQQGMASSIVAGISSVMVSHPNLQRIILTVCDQPFVSSELFTELIKTSNAESSIVACSYADTIGTPVLFTRNYFTELLQLKGEDGAKKLLKLHHDKVALVDFPQGKIDIDTPEDYKRLVDKQSHVL